ncbi:MAG: ThuA domain-containing protein [Myxococcota bacterium]
MSGPLQAWLVCGGRWHDFDYARLELLKLLAERPEIRTRVSSDYADTDTLAEADLLVTYTCDVRPELAQERALLAYLERGGRWLALHGTNSVLEFLDDGRVSTPRLHGELMAALGSRFLAHPPIGPFQVENVQPGHPLVAGIEDFEVEDELYLSELEPDIEVLLQTRFVGKAPGFVAEEWPDDEPRPVLYLHRVGAGQVLYLTLGHCRGPFDMRPLIDVYPRTERCAWQHPTYTELLRRGILWASGAANDRAARSEPKASEAQ